MPGIFAGRRVPVTTAAVAAGVAIAVVIGTTSPLTWADTASTKHSTAHGSDDRPLSLPQFGLPASAADTSAAAQTLPVKPVRAPKTASTDRGVISGLAANGIPKIALNAYRVAAARMANVEPSCGIDWAMLAGIGREESDHGRFGGAVLHADGVSTPAIIGPALDGKHWAYIPAPANGLALDGDATYAHALGPMQFIPSTWAIYGVDADGDGHKNIFDINDAALGTARYLCAAGGNLRTHSGRVAGVLAYNHSDQYLAQVLALANAYRKGITITGIPVGITTGPLPKIGHRGTPPPANPGAPTAAPPTVAPSPAKTSPSGGTKTKTPLSLAPGKPSAGHASSGHSSGHGQSTPSSPPTTAGTSASDAPSSSDSPDPLPSITVPAEGDTDTDPAPASDSPTCDIEITVCIP